MDNYIQEVIEAKIEDLLVAGERISSPSLYGGNPSPEHLIRRVVDSRKVNWEVKVWLNHESYLLEKNTRRTALFCKRLEVDADIMPPFSVLYPALQFLYGAKCFIRIDRIP